MIDFNIKENNYQSINNDVELVLQQIDLLFDTTPGEVLGDVDFGSKYDKYLWDLQLSASELEQVVITDLNTLEMRGFSHDVEVILLQGSENDIAIIKILLTRDDEKYENIYRIR